MAEQGWEWHRLADPAATRALGRVLAGRLLTDQGPSQDTGPRGLPPTLLLGGELGAGKTCLVQGLAEGLGISEAITSPSFALAQHYQGHLARADGGSVATALVHLDLYRLEQPAAAEELLAQEEEEASALGAVLAIEWPQRLASLPPQAWQLHLELADLHDPTAGRIARLLRPERF